MKLYGIGLALVIAASLAAGTVDAAGNRPAWRPGQLVASASLGFGVSGVYGDSRSPLLAVSGEYGVNRNVSVGAVIGLSGSSQHYAYFGESWDVRWRYTVMAVRGSYHLSEFIDNDKVDLYAGASLGYNTVSVGGRYMNALGGSYALYGLHAGGRYFFTDRVGAFAEVGYGLGDLALGVSARF